MLQKTVKDKSNRVKQSSQISSHERRSKQPLIGIQLDKNFDNINVLMLLKGLPHKNNICWFISVLTAMINSMGAYRRFETAENQSIYFWKTFHDITSYLRIWVDITELPKGTHLPLIQEYCNNYCNQFSVGKQENFSEFLSETQQ